MADEIEKTGADVVVCQTSISDQLKLELLKRDIFAVEYVVKRNMRRLARVTGGRVMADVEQLSEEHLGRVANIEQRTVGAEDFEYLFFESEGDARSLSFIFRGKSEEAKRVVKRGTENGFSAVKTAIQDGEIVPGGGASETEVAVRLRDYATKVTGREQLAIEGFASALEYIPRTLAENAGKNVLDTVAELRSLHGRGHPAAGIVGAEGVSPDVTAKGIVESKSVKTSSIGNAADVANLLLGVDGLYTPQEFIDRVSEEHTEQINELTDNALEGLDEQVESIAENAS